MGYARTSSAEQKAGSKLRNGTSWPQGVRKVFSEQVSSVAKREKLEAALDFVREGDTLIVTKVDRLSRGVAISWRLWTGWKRRGLPFASFRSVVASSIRRTRLEI